MKIRGNYCLDRVHSRSKVRRFVEHLPADANLTIDDIRANQLDVGRNPESRLGRQLNQALGVGRQVLDGHVVGQLLELDRVFTNQVVFESRMCCCTCDWSR